jgi:ATP synthase protein I
MTSQKLILRAALPTFIVGALATITGFISSGIEGLIAGVFGTFLVVIFFAAGQLALDKVIRTNPGLATSMALLLYLIKIAILFVLLLLFQDTQAFDTKVFAATIVSCTVVWLVAETWAFATAKVLYVEPGSGPDVRPVDTFEPKDL